MLSSLARIRLPDPSKVKQLKDKIVKSETRLHKLISEAEGLWEETGLDPKDPSYLVEKTMRFEVAQKNLALIFSSLEDLVGDYKKLCQELERQDD